MNKSRKLGIAAIAAVSVMVVAPAVADSTSKPGGNRPSSTAGSFNVVGLGGAGTTLVKFDTRTGAAGRAATVSGLSGGDTALTGIDYRVQDGKLYGVGNDAASAGIYSINPDTGVATPFATLTLALSGTAFGVDFNPAANALRIVSNTGQNLRQPFASPVGPTVKDTDLTYPPAAGVVAGVTAAAYTNNDLDASTGTTLFDLDTALDQVAIQSPANSGTLAVTGKLGLDATGDVGFDIYSTLSRSGATEDVRGVAVINGSSYEISLLTGKATRLGPVGRGITDIAIPLK